MTAHKKGGAHWRTYQPIPAQPKQPTASWWAAPQTWDEFSRAAAIETERMRHGKALYFGLSMDRFAIWG